MNRKNIELRDWYAGLAMQALVRVYGGVDKGELIAAEAFYVAREMMRRREKDMDRE